MADYTTVTINANNGTDASPTWSGTAIPSSGTGELRLTDSGTGATTTTPSASWPSNTRPTSGVPAAVRQAWLFSTDILGFQALTYDGTRNKANVFRFSFDALGTLATAPRISAFANSTNPTPVPGTQVSSPTDGGNIINGASGDTGTGANILSYLYGNAYGSGLTVAGVQETPAAGAVGTTLTCGSHSTAGAASPAAASWLTVWQDLQGWNNYIVAPVVPKPTTAFFWYFSLCLFMGANMLPGNMPFCPVVLDYTWT